jgi:putative oxidoreductase
MRNLASELETPPLGMPARGQRRRMHSGGEMFPNLENFADFALVFLRLMVGLVFIGSGYNDLKDPDARSQSVGLPKGLTIFIAIAELLGGVAVIVGVLSQLAAIGLIIIMLGAIQKKVFVWKTGFWGKDGLGWNYELILVSMLLVILCTNGGRFVVY